MNDAIKKELVGFMQKVNGGIDKSVDFLKGELPEYIEQLLMWHGLSSFLEFFIPLCVLSISLFVLYKGVKAEGPYFAGSADIPQRKFFTTLVGGVCSFIFLITTIECFNLTWLKIWVAPKIFIVDYIASLAK